jgi:nucleotide-binding universal stress UspA family protein
MFQQIVVPLDGSQRAERAVPTAARIAHATNGTVVLLQAVTLPVEYLGSLTPAPMAKDELIEQELAMQPLNQATERASREVVLGIPPHFGDALRSLVGDAAWQTILTFRVGYSTHEGLRSPRRAVNAVVKP